MYIKDLKDIIDDNLEEFGNIEVLIECENGKLCRACIYGKLGKGTEDTKLIVTKCAGHKEYINKNG